MYCLLIEALPDNILVIFSQPVEETSTTKSQSSTGSLKDHLWQEFKKYVFPMHEPLCVCKDSETFQAVMAVINKFEREVCSY